MKQVLLVDDLPDALAMLEAAVLLAFPAAYCQHARTLADAHAACAATTFDLALIDLGLPDGLGTTLIAALANRQPDCQVIVATIHAGDEHLFPALQAGAQGYLLKDESTALLARQLQGIAGGQPPLSPAVARRLLQHFQQPLTTPDRAGAINALSAREREVLVLLARGIQLAGIAATLGISRHTVGDHVKNIYRKLNISSRAEAALRAHGMGLV